MNMVQLDDTISNSFSHSAAAFQQPPNRMQSTAPQVCLRDVRRGQLDAVNALGARHCPAVIKMLRQNRVRPNNVL